MSKKIGSVSPLWCCDSDTVRVVVIEVTSVVSSAKSR